MRRLNQRVIRHGKDWALIKIIGKLAQFGNRLSFGVLPVTLISFLIVGSLGVVVHLLILKAAMASSLVFSRANLCAMLGAATFNFFLNNESTFKERSLVGRHIFLGYLLYVGVNVVGMSVSLLISSQVYSRGVSPILSALAGIVAGAAWNYLMSYTLVWKLLARLLPGKNA